MKYYWLGLSITLMVIISAVGAHFNLAGLTEIGITVNEPSGILAAFDFISESIGFFWALVVFQVEGVPPIMNAILLIPAMVCIAIVVSIIRGVE